MHLLSLALLALALLALASTTVESLSAAAMSAYTNTPLTRLLTTTKEACDLLTPMVAAFYTCLNSETSKLKADASVFTIADGMVQHLLIDHLFCGGKFKNIVGEEDDTHVNIASKPFTVDDLTVPDEFCDLIEGVRDSMSKLSATIASDEMYKKLTIFIDPIDGTREFATNLGEECSICIGFSDERGRPVAGIVYRPLTAVPTWAAGASSEHCVLGHLNKSTTDNTKSMLTSRSGISKFVAALIAELGFDRIPAGGAGNKMLLLLEGKGGAYIQDRGVSRWDTAGAQAVIEAYGGTLSKLSTFAADKALSSYTYLKSPVNLDFEPNCAILTPYNAADKKAVKKGEEVLASSVEMVKAYSNLCGILALSRPCMAELEAIHAAIQRAASTCAASYD